MRDPAADGLRLGAPLTGGTRGPQPAAAAAGLGLSPVVTHVCIDAGVGHLRLIGVGERGERVVDTTLPSDERLRGELLAWRSLARVGGDGGAVCITGKLAPLVREALGCGATVLPAAAAWLAAARDKADLPLPRISVRRYLRRLARHLGLSRWPQNVLRHTAASYLLALHRDAPRVALHLGNSPAIILRHYHGLVTREDAKRFWEISP